MILLNPGPVNLSDTVRNALLGPDLCHREPEYFQLQRQVRDQLLDVYGLSTDAWAAVMLSGSGTAAMESMLTSLVPRDGKVLIIENGVYGERLSKITQLHQIPSVKVSFAWGEEISAQQVAQVLSMDPDITHMTVVHHETTTGRLNDLNRLAELCDRHQVDMLIDGISSFGAEAIDFDRWPIAAVAATANKCLHGIPGLAFVIGRRSALVSGCEPARSLYLDLKTYLTKQDDDSTPFTPAVPAYYALTQALAELTEQGGWPGRQQRYADLACLVSEGLAKLDIQPYLPADASSVVLRAYYLPQGMDYHQLHDNLKKQGFVIYAGQGGLEKQLFRISTMGTIATSDIARLLQAFGEIVCRQ